MFIMSKKALADFAQRHVAINQTDSDSRRVTSISLGRATTKRSEKKSVKPKKARSFPKNTLPNLPKLARNTLTGSEGKNAKTKTGGESAISALSGASRSFHETITPAKCAGLGELTWKQITSRAGLSSPGSATSFPTVALSASHAT